MFNPLRIEESEVRITDAKAIRSRLWGKPQPVEKHFVGDSTPAEPIVPPQPSPKSCKSKKMDSEEVFEVSAIDLYRIAYSSFDSPASRTKALIKSVAEKHGVSIQDMKGSRRTLAIVRARMNAYYELAYYRRDLSYPEIARIFNKDHTTVLWGAGRWAEINGLPPVARS